MDITTKTIIQAFINLDVSILSKINGRISYSFDSKNELISKFNKLFNELKSKGLNSLKVETSKCRYCYPSIKNYSFHHPITDEFIFRYVIFRESSDFYRIEECKNSPSSKSENSIPF